MTPDDHEALDTAPTFHTYAERQRSEAIVFAGLAGDMGKLADMVGDTRAVLRKAGAAAVLTDTLARLEADARGLEDRLDRLAAQPLPLPLRSMMMAGSA